MSALRSMIACAAKALALCASLAAAACAQTPNANTAAAAPPEPALPVSDACGYNAAIFLNPAIARQGTEVKIVIDEPVGAFAPRPIPAELLTDWKASPAGQVMLAPDGSKFTVLDTATPGTDVTLSASFCGKRQIARTIRIAGKDEAVLTGLWHEESKQCFGETPQNPVNEFEIRDVGQFSVTFFPFESYRDYWGKIAYDTQAGTLAMTIENGNAVPSGAKLSGKMKMTGDGKLVLDGFFLSQPQRALGVCTYTFRK